MPYPGARAPGPIEAADLGGVEEDGAGLGDGEATDSRNGGAAIEEWQAALESYWPAFATEYARLMRAKLGLTTERDGDAELVRDLLAMLQKEHADYPIFFRQLCDFPAEPAAEPPSPPAVLPSCRPAAWLARYAARLRAEGSCDADRRVRMRRVNPNYVLRNWIAQEAIAAAERKEFGTIEEIRRLLARPFDDHRGQERYAAPPSAEARALAVSCSS